ncbi:D-glycero-beta-D-manno-heptose-7-phosphate kinase [Ferrovum myxofaciens]|jgi:rfaE bifunctional protein kinase chain/domain|uniref:D-beta-D-heptose 7-phosphate kinase n=2 Tax=root TaxID=1 RepID=A0A859A9C2_9PROT|nr:D-glycero-beta-D-manno-heptose-7-phosphate kinase [Ferrovum myxofaciens]NDU88770.1 D-glycero-beta-D-manno-heptose-7-phosphate kinase [Ferrovum sp.]KXW58975.1 D-beta-D-heptose 7-phosphate kinase [Ferrovum myxofaciens]MBU6993857.1 D-glycero-beta-D-manno-heptose-7-phosphate kinase [Ferrovum myxofaciens]QKE37756.1 MAG: D-glycero-beta-D-manno-heptose-7-phosphate kinase [Ferrovum myxofaciens]QKE40235.1 MAG: D-glycero-beta-D-manno-heptose-7-phosphate kinase [Ferrovum myxofaciens]
MRPFPPFHELSQRRVLVVGDVMLDRYWFGEVNRISPEAPVPVVLVEKAEERPGGAANVARGVAALGAQCELLAVTGEDEAAQHLEELLAQEGVISRLHRDPSIATTVKLRVMGRQQQLLRIDFETLPRQETLLNKLTDFGDCLKRADVVILSDYGKGALKHVASMINQCRKAGIPVLVDPKGEDYRHYRGATLLTPNRTEFRQVAGPWHDDQQLAEKAQTLRTELGLDALLVTRSEEGMSLYQAQGVTHEPTVAREVYDVSGAGDTVIATLGVLTAQGMSLPVAMRWANRAAGIAVSKLGTAVVTHHELENMSW